MKESLEMLKLIRQTSDLIIMNKSTINNKDIFSQICPDIPINKVIKIMKLYHKDEYFFFFSFIKKD
jgi:hypothetical protein